MKYLIAGYGSIGRRHLRNLRELGRNDLVLLRSHKSTLPEDEIFDVPVETNIEAALAHQPDGVIIANPTRLHLDVAIPAAKAGCAILMEKPVTDQVERIPALAQALQNGGGRLLMGFQYRFHPGLQNALKEIQAGAIGRPLSFRAEWGEYLPDWHPWEDYRSSYAARTDLGGGVALTLCHPLDYLRWMFGEVSQIWGFSDQISDLEICVDDVAEIGMAMKNGMVGSVHLDYYRQPGCNRLEVCGTNGVLNWTNDDGIVTVQNNQSNEAQMICPADGFERNWLFRAETAHFIDVTENGATPSCTLRDGEIASRLVALLKRSWTEKHIFTLTEDAEIV